MIDLKPIMMEISAHLDLPQPGKSRILLEIKSDIEDTFAFYLSHGRNEKEAFDAVCEKFKPSKKSMDELTAIHQPLLKQWLDSLSGKMLGFWEKVVFILVSLLFLLLGIHMIFTTSLIWKASVFIWPILVIGCITLTIGLVKIYKLYIKKDHSIRTLRNGLNWIPFLGGGTICLAALGYYWELFRLGSINLLIETKLLYLVCLTNKEFTGSIDVIMEWMIRSSSMIFSALMIVLMSALLWFVIINKVIQIEISEAEIFTGFMSEGK